MNLVNKIKKIQFHFRVKEQVNKRRLDLLTVLYCEGLHGYHAILKKSKNKKDKKLDKDYHNHDMGRARTLLALYYARCKLVHRAALYQSLAKNEGAEVEVKFDKLKLYTENDFATLNEMKCWMLRDKGSLKKYQPHVVQKGSTLFTVPSEVNQIYRNLTKTIMKRERHQHYALKSLGTHKSLFIGGKINLKNKVSAFSEVFMSDPITKNSYPPMKTLDWNVPVYELEKD